ncbi:inositol monophosphatase family protein [Ponticaulis sp.]|uniref:inositol monophosphatase family protein n=1 Tax=Ponticaulis sp. TaxID=2020902 RepID=UPI000B67BAE3|nr:inositol monophosphatase family protein [Ponticaulis sp.]MAI89972.1 inositol monophosphatase [Ponticaulis sp.]OUX99637.1 MAG: inositol monophosphatase [Hyphomonadaceae bacterium TMED5]
MSRQSPLITVMVKAARAAGRGLARDFGEVENLQVSKKGPGDFVTNADHRAEDVIYNELSRARPGYGFVMEERGVVEGTDKTNRFIVDPLDGTLNFMHGIPHFAISIGHEREGELHAGVVYDVIRGDIYWAERGHGAWLENWRLKVATRIKLTDAVLATGTPYVGHAPERHQLFWSELAHLTQETSGIRRFGAAALDLAYVAAGRFDGFWERNLKPWDIAAGIVLVREAGGIVQELDGGEILKTGNILATNASLAPKISAKLATAKSKLPS